MTVITSNLNWGKDHWKAIIESDAKGYYAYLPAVFIYKDLNFDFFQFIEKEKYYNENLFYDYRTNTSNGKVINKYYCGTALVQLPFFIIAHFSSYLGHYEMDGYSKLYPVLISIAAIFYLLMGLFYLDSILDLYKVSEPQKILVLLSAVFGTNLFYYTVGEPGMSHIYSFAFIAMFIFYVKLFFLSFKNKYIIIISILLGIILLIRPINGLIVFIIPFLASNISAIKEGFNKAMSEKWQLVLSFCILTTILSIQLIYYKLATGDFLVYSYAEEGFNFLKPHISEILFSYKKGLFIYTPMFLLSLTGTYYLWKSSKFEFYSIITFLFLIVYIFSSWWMWYYGGSFSSRVFVEYIALFMILLAIALNRMQSRLLRIGYISSIVFFIFLCQLNTYQYRYNIIHWSEMTKEKYWNSYLQIGRLIK
ncbi:hypothetical protein [Sporocytophaga myxococcoides]|uniref:hypothetical protein n=1 Tax=Sporocytophaga myxococcoides TaxID=153721 RepID=UPI0012DDDDEF|nr:hypothetical protein [Sporocytophaga myxococcoides]